MCWIIIQHYLFVYHSYCLLYCLISTVNVTGCKLLTLSDSQLEYLPKTLHCVVMFWNINQYYLWVYQKYCLLYCPTSIVKVTVCTVMTLCEVPLAVPASNCTLFSYVLELYSTLFVCLSQIMFVILPYIYS